METLMKIKSALTFMIAVLSILSNKALADEALYCYTFYGVTYKTLDNEGKVQLNQATTNIMLESTTPLISDGADVNMHNDQLAYAIQLNGTLKDILRLELTDLTNGQKTNYWGPSKSFMDGVDTCIFLDPAKDSTLKVSWSDLEYPTTDPNASELKVVYTTVQCNIVHGDTPSAKNKFKTIVRKHLK